MDSSQKKGINFDLDTDALKKYYSEGDWHKAYYDIRGFFERNGFEHIQGSGYHSVMPMSEAKAMTVIYNMTKYSLQGTTQGNGLTGADMPVRFSM